MLTRLFCNYCKTEFPSYYMDKPKNETGHIRQLRSGYAVANFLRHIKACRKKKGFDKLIQERIKPWTRNS